MRVAIIGTAGRGVAIYQLNAQKFAYMCEQAESIIARYNEDWKKIELVSGGAAWADHVAVRLFQKHAAQGLTLYVPAPWDVVNMKFQETHKGRGDAGAISNYYHKKFSDKVKCNSLEELHTLNRLPNCLFETTHKGFKARNNDIAAGCDVMIAFSMSLGSTPIEGGTADTWSKCKIAQSKKHHVSLLDLK